MSFQLLYLNLETLPTRSSKCISWLSVMTDLLWRNYHTERPFPSYRYYPNKCGPYTWITQTPIKPTQGTYEQSSYRYSPIPGYPWVVNIQLLLIFLVALAQMSISYSHAYPLKKRILTKRLSAIDNYQLLLASPQKKSSFSILWVGWGKGPLLMPWTLLL